MQGMKGLMLTYRRTDALEIVGYSDADLAGCKDTLKSTSGYVFLLAGGAISWKSAKQSVVTSSTMYAEFIACFETTGQAMWIKKFVPSLRLMEGIERPLKIYCDNEPAVFYSYNNKSSAAAKHIELKYYVVKEKVQDQTIEIVHKSAKEMIADLLTKGLSPDVFKKHVAGMGLRESL